MNVKILATCRKPEYLPTTTLVFDTLRVGFPDASVSVCINDSFPVCRSEIEDAAVRVGAMVTREATIHHKWIESLIETECEPFFIVDTDVIFYKSVEAFAFKDKLVGMRIPEWVDEFSGAVTRARLHTSLLYIDPAKVRAAIKKYESELVDTAFTPKVNLYYPLIVPFKGKAYFYDTCSLLYNAIGGTSFTDEQKDAYFHFHFGTIPDVVMPRLDAQYALDAERRRMEILLNPMRGKGAWREQEQYYAARQL